MCLIIVALQSHPQYPVIIAANRDEFYARPAQPAQFWDAERSVLAGRDLQGGGTWLGVTGNGRFAAVTNYRDPNNIRPDALTRGMLPANFLRSEQSAETYIRHISPQDHRYNGYNILLSSDLKRFHHYSNMSGQPTELTPEIHGLSNHLLDTPWPKVEKAKSDVARLVAQPAFDPEGLFRMLSDSTIAPDEKLPETGIGRAWERVLSPICIRAEGYGTRCSTVILINGSRQLTFEERTLQNGIEVSEIRKYSLDLPV